MSGYVPPPAPAAWQPPVQQPFPALLDNPTVQAPSPPAPLGNRVKAGAWFSAVLAGLCAWFFLSVTLMDVAKYIAIGGVLGAMAVLAIALLRFMIELAFKLLVIALKVTLVMGVVYVVVTAIR